MDNTFKERLCLFINELGISQRRFELSIGVSNGFVKNISKSIGAEKLRRILETYPQLNQTWLMCGEGEMLIDQRQQEEGTLIPLLPISAQGGSLNDFIVSVKGSECEKVLSPVRGADFAIPVAGDSMAPEYPNGSQVHIKKINEHAFIEWGKVYVLDTCNGVVIKRVVPSEREGYVRCLSINTNPIYAPFDVAMTDIYGIYRVMLCLSIK